MGQLINLISASMAEINWLMSESATPLQRVALQRRANSTLLASIILQGILED